MPFQQRPSPIIPLTLFVLTVFLPISCRDTPGKAVKDGHAIREKKFPSGALQSRWTEVDGRIEGVMEEFDMEGNRRVVRTFQNGRENGRTVFYNRQGGIEEVQYYREGIKEGGDTMFDASGRPRFVLSYKGGKKHGFLRKWSDDGSLLYEARFDMDTLVEVRGQKIR
ncbi:MAG: hypothetical protein J5I41_01370 [Saprospiraceae bacterium]|nr:hypothetical protein [Saprospiraceae bacterium]